jgi:mono/diheme cytochrome c family protein
MLRTKASKLYHKKKSEMNSIHSKLLTGLMLMGALFVVTSCNKGPNDPGLEFMPDMYRNPAYKAFTPSALFADSTSARMPVAGTIPRDYTFFNYPASNEGYLAAGRDLKNPLEPTFVNLAAGKKLYVNFCMHCHGAAGNGDGSLIATGKFPPPPSYSTGASSRGGSMKDLTDGKIFHTITYGINLMGPHASQLNYEERWKITMYVKSLSNVPVAAAAPSADTTAAAQ